MILKIWYNEMEKMIRIRRKVMKNVRKIGTFICVLTLFFMLFPLATVNATTKEQYKVSGKVIKPVVKKGKDISKNVNAALKIATKKAKKNSIYTVKIPAGTYYITESLKIRSNTILDATGCTIKANIKESIAQLLKEIKL